jgi:hypothetical protein
MRVRRQKLLGYQYGRSDARVQEWYPRARLAKD